MQAALIERRLHAALLSAAPKRRSTRNGTDCKTALDKRRSQAALIIIIITMIITMLIMMIKGALANAP